MRGQQQAISITSSQQFCFLALMLSEDWTNGVNDVLRGQFTGGGDYCFACRQPVWISCAPDFATGFDDCRAANAMNRTVNTGAAHQ